ncbi:pyridoxamine 5'-phosphate oxidase [Psychroflexus planctonicus]|uniref:Pyridoxine/pyridoxamine 5'-phosphate oxidase n=1 Tax=Psychroflexus planctonicus TaxID=1526575 RepID=A0ABQ1SCW0_9FLAO|nr:pyridoxamine 5'-phosphate oxidase [Psychroflexus planctonicus]GGE29235.1 pyridoxine/pyridoxamine 5'-phosphate oxidase [Psychroflexus planctonicus]
MKQNLHNYRKSYEKAALVRENLDENPLQQFRKWFYEVDQADGVDEANAMSISTIGEDGFPKTRVVLLKSYDENGFVFYTNYESEKGKAILANPKVCLSFFWPSLERQVIIKGKAEKVPENISDNYFSSRPLGSQLGAMASDQSRVIEDREVLENKLKSLENKYKEQKPERPKNWGGFVVKPESIEFWQGRPNRLHDRFLFSLQNGLDWKIERLAP